MVLLLVSQAVRSSDRCGFIVGQKYNGVIQAQRARARLNSTLR